MPPEIAPPTAATPTATPPAEPGAPAAPAAEAAAPATPATLLTGDAPATPAEGEAKPAEGEAKPVEGAPAEYADFTAPEGVTLNAESITEFKEIAKARGLSQEDAQKLVDLAARNVDRVHAAQLAHIEKAQAQWAADSAVDKEFGGDNLSKNLAVAKAAMGEYASPALVDILAKSGLGNHPEVIRLFFRVGMKLMPDQSVPGGTRPVETSASALMYPTMQPKH